MTNIPTPEALTQASQNILGAITRISLAPTFSYKAFTEAFYGDDINRNLASDMSTLITAYGHPVTADNTQTTNYLINEQFRLAAKTEDKRYNFVAEVRGWGNEPHDLRHAVYLQATTRILPLISRQRQVWSLNMQEHNNNLDRASTLLYRMWHKAIGSVVMPQYECLLEEESTAQLLTETKLDHVDSKDVVYLPSGEAHRKLQVFIGNFIDLNMLLLASTGTPISLNFDNVQSPDEGGLRLLTTESTATSPLS